MPKVFIKKTTDELTEISLYIKNSRFITAHHQLADMNNYITDNVFGYKPAKTEAPEASTPDDLDEINTLDDEFIGNSWNVH